MPIVQGSTAPTFAVPNATFIGLAAPSRGAQETCVWRTSVHPGAAPAEHWFDREEIVLAISGKAVALLDGVEHAVVAGDAIIVPAHTRFAIANPHGEPFEAVAVLPVGALAHMEDGEPFVPPTAK